MRPRGGERIAVRDGERAAATAMRPRGDVALEARGGDGAARWRLRGEVAMALPGERATISPPASRVPHIPRWQRSTRGEPPRPAVAPYSRVVIHAIVRSQPGTLLFATWSEALALWTRIVARMTPLALVLMPDHLHAILRDDAERQRLANALNGFAQWRNRGQGLRGAVVVHRELCTPMNGRGQILRTHRYIHLNPCRGGLVDDPLAWPFSTHRDALGCTVPPIVKPTDDGARFHAFVCGDASDAAGAAPPPIADARTERLPLQVVVDAVSAATRTPVSQLAGRRDVVPLLVTAALALSDARVGEVADVVRLSRPTVRRYRLLRTPKLDTATRVIARIAGDPRFAGLGDGDLRLTPRWHTYRHLR